MYAIHNWSRSSQAGPVIGTLFDGAQTLWDMAWHPPMDSLSRSVRRVAHLVLHSKKNVSIVSHSQGCVLTLNALITVAAYGYENQLKKVRWVAAGFDVSVINRRKLTTKIAQPFVPLCHNADPIVQFSRMPAAGLAFFAKGAEEGTMKHHNFILNNNANFPYTINMRTDSAGNVIVGRPDVSGGYVAEINSSMLWPGTRTDLPVPIRPLNEKRIELVNRTRHDARVQLTVVRKSPRTSALIVDPQYAKIEVQVPAHKTVPVVGPDRQPVLASMVMLLFQVNGTSTAEGTLEKPVVVAEPYLADDVDTHSINIGSESPEDAEIFATTLDNGREAFWFGVSEDRAFSLREDGISKSYVNTPVQQLKAAPTTSSTLS